ncbi:MAG: hypothetical protein ACMVY4_13210 [Minwuia sp.]|uniref:hypothetical protein n=1 Tax=Minwuia sp. TaxID=2493630 RepID=UPI003A8AD4B6
MRAALAAIVPVIQEVSDRDQAAFGLRLLRQFEETLHLTPQLLVSWARMQMSLDKDAVALERLTKLEEAGDLPDLAVPVLLDLALAKGDIDLIATVLEDRSVAKMTDVRVRAIADLAVFERRSDLLQQILDQTLPSFRDNEPALMAEILIALGELDEGLFRVQHARRQEIPRLDQLIRLARAEIRLGLDNDAAVTLRRIARAADLDETSMRALAQLYIDTERTRQGLEDFERIRTERPSFAASAGWARLAVREGLDSEVLAWMNEREGLGEDLLSDIAVLGLPDRAPASALEAARRLARDHPSRESDRLLAEALIANGRAGEALTIVEALLPGDSEEASTYVTALNALGRDQAALEFLLQRQAERPLEPALVDELVALAFQLERKDIAYAVADRGDLRKIEETALVELVTNAAEDKRLEIVDRIVAQTGPAFLQARPVLAGEVELARGNPVDARLWAYEAAWPDLGLAEKLGLARLWDRLGEQGNALQLLRSMARDDQTPAFALADLGAAYLRLGREAEGLAVFRELKERRADAPVMENWARLETAAGDPAQALAWLEGASGVSPQALTDIHYIALERPAPELSLLAARRLAAVQPGPSSDRILANALLAQGLAAEALPLIEPLLPGDDDLTEAYVGALTALRRNAEAFAWLEKRRSEGALPLRLADDYISLALDQGRSQLAYAEAGRHALSELPDEVLIALAQSAANDRAFQLFDRIVAELGDEFLADRPVLAASLALAREQEASARDWADKAFAREGRTNSESIQLANVFLALGNPERALGLLSGVARDPETPDTALVDLANAYLTLGRAKEGLPVFRSLIETRTAPGVLEGWARLETAEGQSDRVRDWLKSADNVSAQALADIHYIAAERRADNLAFEAGERYYQTYPGPESRRIYGTTLVARGRAEDAIPVLEELLPGDDELAEAYAGALSAVNRKAEALAFLSRRSEGGRLPVRIADDYMALAIELDQPKLAYAEARRHDLSKFDGDTIASLAENAAEDNDLELIDQIVGQTEAVFWEALAGDGRADRTGARQRGCGPRLGREGAGSGKSGERRFAKAGASLQRSGRDRTVAGAARAACRRPRNTGFRDGRSREPVSAAGQGGTGTPGAAASDRAARRTPDRRGLGPAGDEGGRSGARAALAEGRGGARPAGADRHLLPGGRTQRDRPRSRHLGAALRAVPRSGGPSHPRSGAGCCRTRQGGGGDPAAPAAGHARGPLGLCGSTGAGG